MAKPPETPDDSGTMPTRRMKWTIETDRVIYTCTECDWMLVARLDEITEPMRLFDLHICADHPPKRDVC